MTEPNKEPVFIVGVPRSGTTLLAALVSGHSHLSCGPETHFFDNLTNKAEARITDVGQWPARAVDYLYSSLYKGTPVPNYYGLTREEITQHLLSAPQTVRSVASTLPCLFMKKMGKSRWVDKTPDHLFHVHKIRKHFPKAPIIRIMRDPRDVALSLLNVPWGPDTFIGALLYWQCYHRKSHRFFLKDKYSHTLRYKNMVENPEAEMRKICEFLGEAFEPGMLDTSKASSTVNLTNEPWKTKVTEKIDKSRAFAWKTQLTDDQKREADAICGEDIDERVTLANEFKYIKGYGFDRTTDHTDVELLGRLIRENDVRFWPQVHREHPVAVLFTGKPESEKWLGSKGSWQRLSRALYAAGRIGYYRLRGLPVGWPALSECRWNESGICVKLLLLVFGNQTREQWEAQIQKMARRSAIPTEPQKVTHVQAERENNSAGHCQ